MCSEYGKSSEPILILHGEPGTGKTCLIKKIIDRFNRVAYVKGESAINSDDLWMHLGRHNYDLVVFDDIDTQICERNNFVSQLLSYSDGILEDRAKIVITTNKDAGNVDMALLRPGRLFDMISLEPLSTNEAVKIWPLLSKKDMPSFPNSKITQAELVLAAYEPLPTYYKKVLKKRVQLPL